jgi:hypothetical protein
MSNQLANQYSPYADEADKARQRFMDDCATAKVVRAYEGEALIIGDKVFLIHGPETVAMEWFADALRAGAPKEGEAAA